MKMPSIALVLVACGGRAIVSPDAATDLDAAGDADCAADAGVDVAIDLPPCRTGNDCFWMQTCQSGYCCAGVFDGRECRCGSGPGCSIGDACCERDGGWMCRRVGCY